MFFPILKWGLAFVTSNRTFNSETLFLKNVKFSVFLVISQSDVFNFNLNYYFLLLFYKIILRSFLYLLLYLILINFYVFSDFSEVVACEKSVICHSLQALMKHNFCFQVAQGSFATIWVSLTQQIFDIIMVKAWMCGLRFWANFKCVLPLTELNSKLSFLLWAWATIFWLQFR